MKKSLKIEFAMKRLEANLNRTTAKEISDYVDNIITEETVDGVFLDDGAHGYLLVPPSHPRYLSAVAQEKNTHYNYKLKDGTICLEEDIEAGKFINETNCSGCANANQYGAYRCAKHYDAVEDNAMAIAQTGTGIAYSYPEWQHFVNLYRQVHGSNDDLDKPFILNMSRGQVQNAIINMSGLVNAEKFDLTKSI